MPNWSPSIRIEYEILRVRAERMRAEALSYQEIHAGRDYSYWAMISEIDCLVEMRLIDERREKGLP
jgi:hypothetical protein